MERREIYVRMFQSMELETDGNIVKETEHHLTKLWMILAYVIYYRQKGVHQDALIAAVWPEKKAGAGALKTAVHRLRAMLAGYYGEEFAHSFLNFHNKMCSIGESFELICDFEEFERYIVWAKQSQNEEERFLLYKAVTDLYRGDFLAGFPDMPWVTPVQVYYHNLYLDATYGVVEYYEKHKKYDEAVRVLQKAEKLEKYEERLYADLIRNLLFLKQYEEVVRIYGELTVMLKEAFGLKPSEETTALYQDAVHAMSTELLEIDEVALMAEKTEEAKALFCEFDIFKELYHVYSCNAERSRQEVSFAVINITDLQDRLLAKRSLDCCVKNLRELLCDNLRSGDIVSMCTPSQVVLLLPNAGEEAALKVTERIQTLFFKRYPHSPAKFTIQVRRLTSPKRYKEMQENE